jgi:tetratricopeptide (TPR) repeat protein
MGNTPAAVELLREAIARAPDRVQAYLDFASISFAHDSHEAGIDVLGAGLQRLPDSPQLHLARGVLYVQIGRLDKAEADFAVAERFDPKQSAISVARVLSKYQQSEAGEALALVNERLKAAPKDAFLYYLKAEILSSQGPKAGSPELAEAVRAGLRAVELQPDLVLARNVLSRLYLGAGDVARAVEQCRLALRYDPHDQVALYRLIRAMKESADPADAEQIPGLMKRFREARETARQKEAQENRYRLLVEPDVAEAPPR